MGAEAVGISTTPEISKRGGWWHKLLWVDSQAAQAELWQVWGLNRSKGESSMAGTARQERPDNVPNEGRRAFLRWLGLAGTALAVIDAARLMDWVLKYGTTAGFSPIPGFDNPELALSVTGERDAILNPSATPSPSPTGTSTEAPTSTSTPTPTPIERPTATLSPEEARLAEIEKEVADFKIPADHKEFFIDAKPNEVLGNAKFLALLSYWKWDENRGIWISIQGFRPYVVGEPWLDVNGQGDEVVKIAGVYEVDGQKHWLELVTAPKLEIASARPGQPAAGIDSSEEIMDYFRAVKDRGEQLTVGYPSWVIDDVKPDGIITRDKCTRPEVRTCGVLIKQIIDQREDLGTFAQEKTLPDGSSLPVLLILGE